MADFPFLNDLGDVPFHQQCEIHAGMAKYTYLCHRPGIKIVDAPSQHIIQRGNYIPVSSVYLLYTPQYARSILKNFPGQLLMNKSVENRRSLPRHNTSFLIRMSPCFRHGPSDELNKYSFYFYHTRKWLK